MLDWRQAYRLRWKRRELMWRAWRKRHELSAQSRTPAQLPAKGPLCFACVRNEAERLPYWLQHYRALGVAHFLVVDNDSTDDTPGILANADDVSVWKTNASYKAARFGMDWIMVLLARYGQNRWCLTVDADELLVYPDSDHRPLPELTSWLDQKSLRSFGALMVEPFPKGPVGAPQYFPGQNPLDVLNWIDPTPYRQTPQAKLGVPLHQGGVRERVFFSKNLRRAPTLNKVPLVRWHWRWAYLNSTHSLLPRRLNRVFSDQDYPRLSGALIHTKFLPSVVERSAEEQARRQHFGNSALFDDYYAGLASNPDLWWPQAVPFQGVQQLERLGFVARSDDW